MQLYRTFYTTDKISSDGRRVQKSKWHGSAADASKGRTALKAEDRSSNPETVPVDVPVQKAGLLAFLNDLTK